MSTAVVSTSAALGRPFVFNAEKVHEVSSPSSGPGLFTGARPPRRVPLSDFAENLAAADPRLANLAPASRFDIRPAPEMASSGIRAIDALAGGLPRGCLTEICGPTSSGRTTVLLAALAAATRRGEFCVLVDAGDALDPHSVAAAGVELDRLLWVRCGEGSLQKSRAKEIFVPAACKISETGWRQSEHRLEQLLRATDMLLESGGFGLIALDLCDLPLPAARRIPLATWFRYRRAVEHTPTILLAVEQHPIAGSCSSLLLKLGSESHQRLEELAAERRRTIHADGQSTAARLVEPTHAQLLTGLEITAEFVRSRLGRKPTRSTSAAFAGKTAWAG